MSGKLNSVQALRAVAALAVVCHHVFRFTTLHSTPPPHSIVPFPWVIQIGASGVDVFFVISGFLMMYISEPYFSGKRPASHFIAHRVIRIWPPYAIATLVACSLLLIGRKGPLPFDLQPIRLASIFFVPSFDQGGLLQPIIGPGWTLIYEMMFYISFFLTLCMGREFFGLRLAALLLGLFLIGYVSSMPVAHALLANPVIFEFLLGAAIGLALKRGLLTPTHGWIWIAASAVFATLFLSAGFGVDQRLVAYGLPATLLFIGFYALEPEVRWPRYVTLLGDASYSIYLVHTLIIYRVSKISPILYRHCGPAAVMIISLIAIAAAVVAGLLFFRFVEKPLLRFCQRGYNGLIKKSDLHPPLVAR